MPPASNKSTGDPAHQQADIVDYIFDIANELAQMADRAGCENLGSDLRQAILTAHDTGEKSTSDGL
jgi:hypothetical protein